MTKGSLLLQQFLRLANNQDLLNKYHTQEILAGFGNSELNCIDCIGHHKNPNATVIAKKTGMTRSAISKIVRKLVAKDTLSCYQLPDNQKEVYYRLTSYGKEIFKQHKVRHESWQKRDREFFDTLPGEELDMLLRFMNVYNSYLETKLLDMVAAEAPPDNAGVED